MMGSNEEIKKVGGTCPDVENSVFVAVGKNVKKGKSLLSWTFKSFPSKNICLLHVHQPAQLLSLMEGKMLTSKLKQQAVKVCQDLERQKMQKLLNQYDEFVSREQKKEVTKIWIETANVEEGIVELIRIQGIRWFVMGGAAEKYYSKNLAEIKSRKAIFVHREAPVYCQMWFLCNGCLIYTKSANTGCISGGLVAASPTISGEKSVVHKFIEDENENANDVQILEHQVEPVEKVDGFNGEATGRIHHKLEQAAINAENSKQLAFEESLRRWRAEEDAMEALQKEKASERLYIEEKTRRKELEDSLSSQMQELEKLKNQQEGILTELQLTKNHHCVLETHLAESRDLEQELEAKIIQAVKLLIIFKEKRDESQKEHDAAITEANKLMKLVKEDCTAQFFEFSFSDIVQATQNFDMAWKIHEGRGGVIYKGNLRHTKVAIKMLPSNFQIDQVGVLSRVRHPHVVTLMGTCSESEARCLIYEYLDNGSLEDHLRDNARLPWQFRIRIAEEICSALVFLDTNSSNFVHGNLRTTKILLDSNFVSKIADLGTRLTDLKLVGEGVEEVSDVYSYGIILLRLLTGRPASNIVKDVEFALQSETLGLMLDSSTGKWPLEQATQLATLAMRCCDMQPLNRPDLVSEVWTTIHPMRDLCNSAQLSPTLGFSPPKKQHRIPPHFICPIFQEIMKDPHVAADGFTYEGDAISGWLNGGHKTSPMTNLPLDHCDLLPNNALYYAIEEWQQQQS